jgi:hypothetical protein
MQTTAATYADNVDDRPYRALSITAVCSAMLGLLSVLAWAAPVLISVPVLSVVLGAVALRSIAKYPDEISGKGTAWFGIVLSLLLGVGGAAWHSYVYFTEVPEGFARVPFRMLQSASQNGPPPAEALELNNKQIFVKGYMHPDAGMAPVRQFVLVPDMGTCCFGGQPELTDMIQVTLPEGETVSYSTRRLRLAGVLEVDPQLTPVKGYIGVYYKLDASYVK